MQYQSPFDYVSRYGDPAFEQDRNDAFVGRVQRQDPVRGYELALLTRIERNGGTPNRLLTLFLRAFRL